MQLEASRITALDEAEKYMLHSDFCPYLDLKALLPRRDVASREQFRNLFLRFYGLSAARPGDVVIRRYFEILFSDRVIVNGVPDYAGILRELSAIARPKRGGAMYFSFVSKLVAMHDESRPLYDKYVCAFFQSKPPGTSVGPDKRIEWYIGFLDRVRSTYAEWAKQSAIMAILQRFRLRDSGLRCCHEARLIDFLPFLCVLFWHACADLAWRTTPPAYAIAVHLEAPTRRHGRRHLS